MSLIEVFAIGVCVLACACDLAWRKIPNVITLAALLVAVILHAIHGGMAEAGLSLAGAAIGLVLFFPLFMLAGMGAGDVKLLAAVGACLGPAGTIWSALWAAVAGGVLGLLVALLRGYLGVALANLRLLILSWHGGGIRPVDGLTLSTSKGPRLPYALPITAGLLLTLWLR